MREKAVEAELKKMRTEKVTLRITKVKNKVEPDRL
jgi:hypothetical protein